MAAIDHFFVFTRLDAPEQQQLVDRGITVTSRREHAGQGTQNVCFAFADSYLELIWVSDEEAARDPMVKPLGLYERMRWRDYRASPFGICLRPDQPGKQPPFASWDYQPAYLPEGARIKMGCNSGVIGEPLLFQLERTAAPDQPPQLHRLSQHRLRKIIVTTPALAPMSPLHDLNIDGLELRPGEAHLMEVELHADQAPSGQAPSGEELDLRPSLPLILRC